MDLAATLPIASAAILVGGGLLGLIWLGLRWFAAHRPEVYVASPVRLPVEHDVQSGVVVAQAGGHVTFANDRARQFFALDGQAPSLWRMAQRAQPSDTFLELFVREGQANLSIGEWHVEATSLRVPSDDQGPARMVLLLRETGQLPELAAADESTAQAMDVISELSRAINASLDLAETLDAIVANVGRAFQYNIAEITLWDAAAQVLRPARYAGDRNYERELAQTGAYYYAPGEGFTGYLAAHRAPLLVSNVETFTQARPKLERADFPFRAYMGAPLLIDRELIGTLELVSYRADTYRQSDLILFDAIADQAALAIQNAQRYAEQERRVAELTGLADITRAIESTADPRELYGRLTADIARLMGVQLVGFLQYDAHESALIGQAPFQGVPDIVVDAYRVPVARGSVAERIWQEDEYWLSNDVPADPLVDELGLRPLAETAGVKTTLLAPIIVGGRRLGVVQVSNKTNGAPFASQDVHLLTIFAGQAAAILENARLVGEARARAEREEGLRQIVATIAAGTNLDDILRQTMEQTAALLKFDMGMVALLNEARGELAPHPASIYGGTAEDAEAARIRTDDPMFAFSVTRMRRPFISGFTRQDRRITGLYRAIIEHFEVESAMDVPLVVGDHSIGEIVVGARRGRAFTRADLQLLTTVAAQLASAIERSRLYAATDQNLQRRVEQLTALTRVGREINQTLELGRILRLVHDEVLHTARADCGTIVLLDVDSDPGTVALRIGEESLGQTLTPIEREAVGNERLRRLNDLPADSPLVPHAGVVSLMVVPIQAHGTVVGVIQLHTRRPEGFDDSAVETTGALAAQMAIAVSNAQRYEDQLARGELLRRRADQLAQLFQISRTVRSDRPLEENLEAIAFGLQEAVGFNLVLISMLDPRTRRLRRTAGAGIPLAAFEELKRAEQPWAALSRVLVDEFRLSQSYFLPHEKAAHLTAELALLPPPETIPGDLPPGGWHPNDMLIVPLRGSGEEPVGVLVVDDPRDGRRPDRSMVEIIEIFANQAALAIENARLYQATEHRAARLLALHRVVERASKMTDRERVWQAVAETLIAEMRFDLCLIALEAGDRWAVQGRAGQFRPEVDFAPIFSPAPAAIWLEPLLVLSTREGAWAQNPLVVAAEVTSCLSVPIRSQARPAGMLFVGSRQTPPPFAEDDLELFVILANQLGGVFESAQLEADIRQRATQLSALAEVSQTITATLRTEDVVQAVLANLRSIIAYDTVTLWLREGQQLRVAAAQGFENDAERIGLKVEIADSALFAEMASTRHAVLVPDVRSDPRFPAGSLRPTRSWLAAPLASKGQIIGALALEKIEPHYYASQATQVLTAFANQAAVALDNARLFEESQQRALELDARSQRLALLNRVSAQLSSTLDVDRILRGTLQEVANALGVEGGMVVTLTGESRAAVAAHLPATKIADPDILVTPALARVRESLAPLSVEDALHDAVLAPVRAKLAERGVKSVLIVPLVVGGTLVAALQLEETTETRHFTPGEIELAQTFANQAAIAVQNARLYAETQARLAELAMINQISRAISSTIDLEQLYQTLSEQVREALGVESIMLALYDEQRNLMSYPLRIQPGHMRAPRGLTAHVIRTRQPLLLRGDSISEQLSALYSLASASHVKSYLGVPLLSGDRVLGALSVQDFEQANVFDHSHERILTTIAAQVAVAIENARFAQELEERVAARTEELKSERERVETLLQITTELSSSLDLDLVLARALELVTQAVHASQGSIFMVDLESNQLIYRATLGRPKPLPPGGEVSPLKRHEGLVGWVIKNRQAVVTGDLDADGRWKQLPEHEGRHKSALAVPLMANEDALGAMILLSRQYNAFDEKQMRLVAAAANQVGAAINNAELYRLIRDQAERLGGMLRAQQVEATKSRAILEGIADGVLVADADGKVILFNAACERVLGIRRDDIVGRGITEFVGIYGATGRAWIEAITRWSIDPTLYTPGEFFAERLQLEDQRVISVHLAPVIASEEYLGSVSVIRDITREVEVDRLKSEFVTNVSHELRTPMTSIKGYADVLLMGGAGPVTPNQAKFLEVIKSNADRLSLLLNDLLDISRIESGRVELVWQAIDIGEVIAQVADTLKGQMDEAGKPLTLTADAPPNLPPVWGDRQRVTQIITNLADNSFNYTHAGGSITLRARIEGNGREMRVEVSDTGVGIPLEDQARLFDRFYRGEDALVLATAGTGLGLPIARQLIDMHGGRIWLVHSEIGQGTTFALTLPLAAENDGQARA